MIAGEEFEITHRYENSENTGDGSSSSSGHSALLERILDIQPDGVEVEFDLPLATTAEERAREWQFPARVLRASSGKLRLLNKGDLSLRLNEWLKKAKLSGEACGQYYFTWTAFKVECDPQAAVETIASYDLGSVDLADGAAISDPIGAAPAKLIRTDDGFAAMLRVDAGAVRRMRAESDVVVGNLMNQPVTFSEALRKREQEEVSGTISISFRVVPGAGLLSRSKETKIKTVRKDGSIETSLSKEWVERKKTRIADLKTAS